jgi:phenylacetate-coenzyme A ligase PaaK-like adenylate-forming protein
MQEGRVNTVMNPFLTAQAAAAVMACSHASSRVLAQVQQQRLCALLAAAREHSVVYRERLRGLPDDASALARMAPVARDELMGRFDGWVTDPALRLDALRAFTADPARIGDPYLGRYLVWESSGTSGAPGVFVQDAAALAVYDALETLRRRPDNSLRRWFDPMGLGERLAFVGATNGHFASQINIQRLARLQSWRASSIRSFSILQPMGRLVDELNAFAPTVLATYPTAALVLAEQVQRGALKTPVREVWTGGETLGVGARERIEQAFGAELRNSYGASEFLAMGWACARGRMHLNTDWLLLEPVDEHQRPVPAGAVSHSVLLTNLANTVQPLIRYALGDRVRLDTAPCACGSPLPTIEVVGRHDDILRLRGVAGRTVALLPLALSTVMEEGAGVFDFQIVQRDDHTLVVRLPERGDVGKQALARCRTALVAFASEHGVARLQVLGELGQAVPRGRSGKACRVQVKSG